MFRCNHCKREYGGIRGITTDRTIDRCPRCIANSKHSPLTRPPLRYRVGHGVHPTGEQAVEGGCGQSGGSPVASTA